MANTDDFSREWITIGEHRVLLYQRDGAPGVELRRAAMLAVWKMDLLAGGGQYDPSNVRLAQVFLDNRHTTCYSLTFAALQGDKDAVALAMQAGGFVEGFFEDIGVGVFYEIHSIPPGMTGSDSYDHTEHLTLGAIKAGGGS